MTDIIIVGSGPAGATAAIYAVRAGMRATMVSMGAGSLERAERIENFYGCEPMSGLELHKAGVAQALSLGAELVEGEVVSIAYDGESFTVKTAQGSELTARAVVLATGVTRRAPKLAGLAELEGRGVSYCAVCDGFFYRGKKVFVLGSGDYAAHEAAELAPLAKSVTILTNGDEPDFAAPDGVSLYTSPLAALEGEGKLERVRFADGETLEADGLFVALGTAGSAALARTLGAVVEGDNISVDANMATTLQGLFAAGDCTGGLLQVAKAASDGAIAGTAAVRYLRAVKSEK